MIKQDLNEKNKNFYCYHAKQVYSDSIMQLSYATTHNISHASLTDNETYSSQVIVAIRGVKQPILYGLWQNPMYCGYIRDLTLDILVYVLNGPSHNHSEPSDASIINQQ